MFSTFCLESQLPESFVGTKLCKVAFGVYGAANYIKGLQGRHPLGSASWLVMYQGSASIQVSELISEEKIVMKTDSFEPLVMAAENKMGLAYLPCFIGDSSRILQKVDIEIKHQSTELSISFHIRYPENGAVFAIWEWMSSGMGKNLPTVVTHKCRVAS